MDPLLFGVVGFGLVFVLALAGIPIGFALGLVGLGGVAMVSSPGAALSVLGILPYGSLSIYEFVVIPLFILMGSYTLVADIAKDLYKTANAWVGGLRGGVVMSTIAACAAFGAACGSSVASAGIFTKTAVPEMMRLGVDKKLALGAVAASGTLATMIPPSVILVLYGIITGTPVGKLLIAGFLPGVVSAIMFAVMVYLRTWRNPALAPRVPYAITWSDRLRSLKGTYGVLILFVAVLGSIYSGLATSTEAAAVGAFGALILAVALRKMTWGKIATSLLDTTRTTSQIFTVVLGGFLFGRFLVTGGVASGFVRWVTSFDTDRYVVLAIFLVLYLFLGCFLDSASMMIVTLPILFPVSQALGFDAIWFGILVVKTTEIGVLTPPLGMNVYVVQSAASSFVPTKLEEVFSSVGWFVVTDIVTLTILVAFPQISLFLPSLMQ